MKIIDTYRGYYVQHLESDIYEVVFNDHPSWPQGLMYRADDEEEAVNTARLMYEDQLYWNSNLL